MPHPLIRPHGSSLVDRRLTGAALEDARSRAHTLPSITLTDRNLADIECIATGVYSPLEGFVGERDYRTILEDMRLASGVAWSIPITLQLDEAEADTHAVGTDVALEHPDGRIVALMRITDVFRPDQDREAQLVYGTDDDGHPGVAAMRRAGSVYLGGPIEMVGDLPADEFSAHKFTPHETRTAFADLGWKTIVAFQTRNPIHRAHEYLTKVALELVDGLFINPLVGTTKSDDIPADVRMRCYQVLMDDYYPRDRVFMGVYPAAMRYAGPREAILHAISRQNYGCTHFIVGRDHAGVGDYYGTYDAQKIFEQFTGEELAISAMKFEHSFYCTKCGGMASNKTCAHDPSHHVFLSGTKVRAMLEAGEMPPPEFSRREVAEILVAAQRRTVEA